MNISNSTNNNNTNNKEFFTIDLQHLIKLLWKKAWLIAICSILAAAIGFSTAAFFITPQYSSSVLLYVNNSSFSLGNTNFSISSSEISAAQSLVKTYIVILKNRTTLEKVIEKAELDYTYEQLYSMINASSVNGTEVLQVSVTSDNPYEAAKIVNCIAEVLPQRISEIIEGSSMEIVDLGVPKLSKVSPSITKHTVVGFILGFIVILGLLVIAALLDDTVHDEEYILQNYNFPILAKVPNLIESGSSNYGYQNYKKKHPNEQTKAGN